MRPPVPRRIHIAPQGYEDERIFLAALDLDAEQVILLSPDDDDERGNRCHSNIRNELEEEGIEVDTVPCDIFDMGETLRELLRQIRQYNPSDSILVNVSAGSKISAIAGMMACMFTTASPYYVHPDGYASEEDHVSYSYKKATELPTFPVAEPDFQLINILDFIHEGQPENGNEGVTLKQIGQHLLDEDLPAVAGTDAEDPESIYPLINEALKPLLDDDLVTKTRLKGGAHIRTTSRGEDMLSLGRSLLEYGEPQWRV